MSTEIYDNFPGRGFGDYALLDEIVEKYGLDRREAHDSIHNFLDQLAGIDGDAVILKSEPVNPALLQDNGQDLDVRYWLTISDDAVDTIRDQFAATYETA